MKKEKLTEMFDTTLNDIIDTEDSRGHVAQYLRVNFPKASKEDINYFTSHFINAINLDRYFPLCFEQWLFLVPKENNEEFFSHYIKMANKHISVEEREEIERFLAQNNPEGYFILNNVLDPQNNELQIAIIDIIGKYGNVSEKKMQEILEKEYNYRFK
jgi:hypothetical protein